VVLWHLSPRAERAHVTPYVGKSVEYAVVLTLRREEDAFALTKSRTSQRTVVRGSNRLMMFRYLLRETSEVR
jgi:hypothetical protein